MPGLELPSYLLSAMRKYEYYQQVLSLAISKYTRVWQSAMTGIYFHLYRVQAIEYEHN